MSEIGNVYMMGEGSAICTGARIGWSAVEDSCLEWGVVDGIKRVVQVPNDTNNGPYIMDNTNRIDELYSMVSSSDEVFIGFPNGPYLDHAIYTNPDFHPYFDVDRNPTGFFHQSKRVDGGGHATIKCRPMSSETKARVHSQHRMGTTEGDFFNLMYYRNKPLFDKMYKEEKEAKK